MIAAFTSGLAARPADYFANGYEPKRLLPSATDELWMLKCVAQEMQQRIDHNRTVIARTAELTVRAYNVALLGVVLAVGVFWGVSVSAG
jgi:hypothetical protein